MQRTVNSIFNTKGWTHYGIVTGDTPDISKYRDFTFYDWCYVHIEGGLCEFVLMKFLDVSHQIGNYICYFVLQSNGYIISPATVQPISQLDK